MSTVKKELKGIGGWLIIIAIGLPINILFTLIGDYYVFTTLIPMMDSEEVSLFTLLLMTDMILVSYISYVGYLFYNKDFRLPQQIKIMYIVNVLYTLIVLYLISDYGLESSDFNDLFGTIFAAAIWIPYFNKSVRVKNTFVENKKGNNKKITESGFNSKDLYNK